jgi:hypothetical protein
MRFPFHWYDRLTDHPFCQYQIYYAGTLLKTTGLNDHDASLVSGFLFTWFFVASFIPWFLIDRVGRRPLLLVCISLMACTFAAQAGLIWKVETTGSKTAGAAATAVLFLYMGLFTTGFQAVVWVYPSEILPLNMRSKGSSISTAANWICNFAIVEMTPSAVANIGYKFYIIFAILNALWVPVIYFMFPVSTRVPASSSAYRLTCCFFLFSGDISTQLRIRRPIVRCANGTYHAGCQE